MNIGTNHPVDGVVAVDWQALRASLPESRYRNLRMRIDPVLATVLLILLMPLVAVIAIAVRLDSGTPVLFRHQRVGRYGVPFTIVKFRTLSVKTPAYSQKVPDDDVRLTRLGRFLRRSGLDEIPQLVNVVRGEMALIGPRPEQLGLIGAYEAWQHERHLLKPGITGWWQINKNGSEAMSLGVDKDIYYVRNQSLRLDAVILFGTVRTLMYAIGARTSDTSPELPAKVQVLPAEQPSEALASSE
jgi:lipopolysaccharide/colanic/teichoic acid biosynthesis glycosyltransferase